VKTPETETFSWTVTCPPPPPPPEPDVAEPPAPPPPTARMSALETPDGTDQEQLVKFVKVKIVNPPLETLVGEHAENEVLKVNVAVVLPDVLLAVIV
jgi:hypothetical protein